MSRYNAYRIMSLIIYNKLKIFLILHSFLSVLPHKPHSFTLYVYLSNALVLYRNIVFLVTTCNCLFYLNNISNINTVHMRLCVSRNFLKVHNFLSNILSCCYVSKMILL